MANWFAAGHCWELLSDRPEGRVKIATLSWDDNSRWCLYLWTLDKMFYEQSLPAVMVSHAKRWAVGRCAVAFDEAMGELMAFQGELVNGEVDG